MELKARRKSQPQSVTVSPVVTSPTASEHDFNSGLRGYRESLNIRCNALLYNTIQNMIVALHTAQDFTYASPSDLIRQALIAYRDGMQLTELDGKGEKISTTIRVDPQTKAFYTALPDRMRSKILERVIRSYMKLQQ